MTAYDPSMARSGLRRWFGLGGAGSRPVDAPEDQPPAPLFHETSRDKRRRQTLEDIARFLLTHRLPITPFTLEAAHDIITGADPCLGKDVAERVGQREPVTLYWLEDRISELGRRDGIEQIHVLIHRLEATLCEFAATASAARSATSDYNSALEAHADHVGLHGASARRGAARSDEEAQRTILELTALAKDMITRTRDIERALARSERETQVLQKNLIDARREAEIDHLTGLPNRRAFEAVLKEQHAECHATGEPLCVAFCDIDHFKRINDMHGHDAGDRVLRTVAQTLARISSDTCHVARHGGEEFVALLRGKRLDEAFATLDALREDMAARKLVNRWTDTPFGRVSFSAGLADVHAYDSPRAALRAADEALIRAKDAGRNRVFIASLDDPGEGIAT
ncbi:diguanylate cyclase [Novosphingobium sp. KA1]|uniref:GGDEF domain-containing protein n=1 Tax=Novosphingobium sp. (strain KA1) TaxID=164608 RepID=UPI001A905DD1|nr:GGDEF domain-containing protein [Novosphingobium sp. KA1]QSR16097.1 GGDEF domain-containing protein [Novosphingobium sp. KA1]